MKYSLATAICLGSFLIGACTIFQAKEPAPPPVVPKKLAFPIGKNWQVIEEPPVLTNERHEQTLPLQSEQSVQPPGAPPVSTNEQRKYENPR